MPTLIEKRWYFSTNKFINKWYLSTIMTAQSIHRMKIQEHTQVLRDALAIGIEQRPATIGFHTSACAIDLLELYLHKTGKIPIGMQVKHDWFKRPKLEQKILPLAQRHIPFEFVHKTEIFELLYTIEEKRNTLIYGHSTLSEIKHIVETFRKLKDILLTLLSETGENFESANL